MEITVQINPKQFKDIFKFTKINDPYLSFYEHVLLSILKPEHLLLIEASDLNVSDFVINRALLTEKVSPYIKSKFKKTKEYSYLSDKSFDFSFAMYELNASPSDSESVEEDTVIIKGDSAEKILNIIAEFAE